MNRFYEGVPSAEYHTWAEISAHDSMQIVFDNPAQWLYDKENRGEPTDAMIFGERAHMAVLEPAKFEERFILDFERPDGIDGRTKAGKELLALYRKDREDYLALHADKEVIDSKTFNTLKAFVKSFREYPLSGIIDRPSFKAETAFKFEDDDTGVICRGLIDGMDLEKHIILEYKTIDKATDKNIRSAIKNYKYDVQAAMYCTAYRKIVGQDPSFIWVFQEKREPHYCRAIKCPNDLLNNGWAVIQKALYIYKTCQESGVFHAYGDKVEDLDVMPWQYHNEVYE